MHLPVKEYLKVILSKLLYIADILSLSIIRSESIFESVFSLQFISKLITVPTIFVQIVVMNNIFLCWVVSFPMCRDELTQSDNVCEAANIL